MNKAKNELDKLDNLLCTEGDYCDFGCDENHFESIKSKRSLKPIITKEFAQ